MVLSVGLMDTICPPSTVFAAYNEIIAGKRGITPETAKGLGEAFGTGPEYWMNLENAYQLWRIKPSDDAVARRARIYSKAPVKEMIRRGWIERSDNVDVLEKSLTKFLGIDSIDAEPKDLALSHTAFVMFRVPPQVFVADP